MHPIRMGLVIFVFLLVASCGDQRSIQTSSPAIPVNSSSKFQTSTGAAATKVQVQAPDPAKANECEREEFYDKLSGYADHFTRRFQAQPVKDQYETFDEYYTRLAEWIRSPTPHDTLDLTVLNVRVPVKRAHYDADQQQLVIDSIAELLVPAVVVGSQGAVPYMAISCAARPWFVCRGNNFWRKGDDENVVAYGTPMQVLNTASFSIPRDTARSRDLLNHELTLDLYFARADKYVAPIREDVLSFHVRNENLPVFAPEIRLEAVDLLVDGNPTPFSWEGRGAVDQSDPMIYAPILERFSNRPEKDISDSCRR